MDWSHSVWVIGPMDIIAVLQIQGPRFDIEPQVTVKVNFHVWLVSSDGLASYLESRVLNIIQFVMQL